MSASGPHAAIRKHSVDLPIGLSHRPRDGSVVSSLHGMKTPNREGHMANHIERRKFLATFGGAAAWPLAARAQQGERIRRIGVLMSQPAGDPVAPARAAAVLQGLQELGWTIGRNVQIEHRWDLDEADHRRNVAELVALAPDVILTTGGISMGPLLQATRTVPIVFVQVTDPVGAGYVESLARPGGNA